MTAFETKSLFCGTRKTFQYQTVGMMLWFFFSCFGHGEAVGSVLMHDKQALWTAPPDGKPHNTDYHVRNKGTNTQEKHRKQLTIIEQYLRVFNLRKMFRQLNVMHFFMFMECFLYVLGNISRRETESHIPCAFITSRSVSLSWWASLLSACIGWQLQKKDTQTTWGHRL